MGESARFRRELLIVDGNQAGSLDLTQRFYREILVPSFPPEELVGPWWEEGDRHGSPFLLALSPDGEVLGGSLGEWYPSSRVLLLAYLAVRPGHRGRGIGTRLMEEVARRWYPNYRLVLGEIEDPRHRPETGQDPWLRIRFYRGFDVKAVKAPYFQPRLRPSSPRVYHMILSVFAASEDALSASGRVRGEILRAFLVEYFAAEEGAGVVERDPQLAWLLAAYDDELDLVRLDDFPQIPDATPPPAM
jgi:GNAT superfamily N-acetyltransferase